METQVTEYLLLENGSVNNFAMISEQFLHNNGNPINSDIMENEPSGEPIDNAKLFAIYKGVLNGIDVESYYFEVADEVNLDEIKVKVEEDRNKFKTLSSFSSISSISPISEYYRTYTWTVPGNPTGTYTIVSNNQLSRATTNANVDGKAASIWNVHGFHSITAKGGWGVKSFDTKMDVGAGTYQKLLSYGPFTDVLGWAINVDLKNITSPISWGFNIGATQLYDQSSLTSHYGKWHYYSPVPTGKLITEPGVRASNANGRFVLGLTHSFTGVYTPKWTTPITYIALNDR